MDTELKKFKFWVTDEFWDKQRFPHQIKELLSEQCVDIVDREDTMPNGYLPTRVFEGRAPMDVVTVLSAYFDGKPWVKLYNELN